MSRPGNRDATGGSSRKGIRIGYFSNFAPRKLGTGENRIVAFARAARERGHLFTLFGREPVHPEVLKALADAGARWEPLADLERRPLRSARRLARELDVLQLNMVAPRSRLALVAYAAWPARVLYVDRVSGPPANTSTGDSGRGEQRPWPKRFFDRLSMVRVHQVAGITEYVRDRAQRRFGLGPERTITLYNGVDTERFRPPERGDLAARPLHILAVANLIPEKGLHLLLEALASLEDGGAPGRPGGTAYAAGGPTDLAVPRTALLDWTLRIAGDGPERGHLVDLATRHGIASRVAFLGLRDDVPELLRESDLFVHPAVWQEALGNTVLEGMASGCAVIASRTGGIPELLEHGQEGLLVPPGDPAALAQAIERFAHDPELRGACGAAARERVERDFRLEDSIARHLDWCERAVGTRRG